MQDLHAQVLVFFSFSISGPPPQRIASVSPVVLREIQWSGGAGGLVKAGEEQV